MKVTIENNELVIRAPIGVPVPSKSQKTLVLASSHGNQTTTATHNGQPVIVGLNAYVRR